MSRFIMRRIGTKGNQESSWGYVINYPTDEDLRKLENLQYESLSEPLQGRMDFLDSGVLAKPLDGHFVLTSCVKFAPLINHQIRTFAIRNLDDVEETDRQMHEEAVSVFRRSQNYYSNCSLTDLTVSPARVYQNEPTE